jgi:hypothetical protein
VEFIMTKSNATEVDVLAKLLKATALPNDAAVNLEMHLHTADPGEGGTTATSEATYASYAAVAFARSGASWSGANPLLNANLLQFPQCSAPGANVITHASLAMAGSTTILYSGALTAPLTVDNGIQPQFPIGSISVGED